MAVVLRVAGLDRAAANLRTAFRTIRGPMAAAVLAEMAETGARTIRRGSKRKNRPRSVRVEKNRRGVRITAGWFGRDYRDVERYLEAGIKAASGRGFRRGARAAERELDRARFR